MELIKHTLLSPTRAAIYEWKQGLINPDITLSRDSKKCYHTPCASFKKCKHPLCIPGLPSQVTTVTTRTILIKAVLLSFVKKGRFHSDVIKILIPHPNTITCVSFENVYISQVYQTSLSILSPWWCRCRLNFHVPADVRLAAVYHPRSSAAPIEQVLGRVHYYFAEVWIVYI